MSLPPFRSVAFVCLCVSFPALSAQSKSGSLEKRLLNARPAYYTPTAAGLQSFHCGVTIDWKDLFQRLQGKTLPDDDPMLKYVQSAHLSVEDNLHSGAHFAWANTGVPDPQIEKRAAQISSGMKQMVEGFLQSWNGYMNGSMVPAPDDTVTLTDENGALHLRAKTGTMHLDEYFDKSMLLTSAHVTDPSKSMDVLAEPTYMESPKGRIVEDIHSIVKQPAPAADVDVRMSVTYREAGGFQLPATMKIDEQNVGTFDFAFTECAVDTPNSRTVSLPQ